MHSTGPGYAPVAGLYEHTEDVSDYIKIISLTSRITARFSKSTLHYGPKSFVFQARAVHIFKIRRLHITEKPN